MDPNIILLFRKYMRGQCTAGELSQVIDLLAKGANKEEWKAALGQDAAFMAEAGFESDLTEEETGKIYARITASLAPVAEKSLHRWPLFRKMWVAAATIAMLAFGVMLYKNGWLSNTSVNQADIVQDIKPGGNRATLVLADGQVIQLDSTKSGIVIHASKLLYDNGNPVLTTAGNLTKKPDHTNPNHVRANTVAYNTLKTPKGGQYQVILEDGTKVWLNAATTLKYPSFFHGGYRKVEVTGEAYFEVAQQKGRPFKVLSGDQEIEVIGTTFNISNYDNEREIRTTLLNGAVQVTPLNEPGEQAAVRLKPGFETIFSGQHVQVRKANMRAAMSWKSGGFYFTGKTVMQVMRELERWYNIQVSYEGAVPHIEFVGSMSRQNTLAQVLRILESTGLHYRIEDGSQLIIINHP